MAVWTLEAFYALILAVVAGGAQPRLGAAILVFVVGSNVVRYLRFRWRLEPDALIIEQGLIRRHRRVIPRERIQTVDLERRIRHRLFGVVEVRVEALGGGATEGKLAALSPETAEALRSILLAGSSTPEVGEAWGGGAARAPGGEEGAVLAHVETRRLVAAGLTGGRVGVGAAIVGFGLQFVPGEWLARIVLMGEEEVLEPVAGTGVRIVVTLVTLALVAGFVLSLVATVLAHWDFTLSREGGTLRTRRGLLTLHRDTVPFRRIQAVIVEENVVRRLLGLAIVQVAVAGRAGGRGGEGTDLILPLGRRDDAFRLAGEVAGVPNLEPPDLHPMPAGARDRRLVRAGVGALVGAGLGALFVWAGGEGHLPGALFAGAFGAGPGEAPGTEPAGVLSGALAGLLLMGGVGVGLALLAYRNLGWDDRGSHMLVREGVLSRKTTVVPVERLQAVETAASPFQRRRHLATLHLAVAQPPGSGGPPRALDLDEERADLLREELVRRLHAPARTPGPAPGN